jgi:hypothetical protein
MMLLLLRIIQLIVLLMAIDGADAVIAAGIADAASQLLLTLLQMLMLLMLLLLRYRIMLLHRLRGRACIRHGPHIFAARNLFSPRNLCVWPLRLYWTPYGGSFDFFSRFNCDPASVLPSYFVL